MVALLPGVGALVASLALLSGAALPECDGAEEEGIRWDVVREDLVHIVQEVLGGALARDLQASKDSGGRDPAVSYGDVQLHRHLERFQRLAEILPERPLCELGRQCVQLVVSALYSGLQWGIWLRRHQEDLAGIIHDSNWTAAVASGWPVLDILVLLAYLHGGVDISDECGSTEFQNVDALLDGPRKGLQYWANDLLREPPCNFAQSVAGMAVAVRSSLDAHDSREVLHLDRVQAGIRRLTGASEAASYAQAFTAPIPSLLRRISVARQRPARVSPHLDIVYCGHVDAYDELSDLCGPRGASCDLHVHITATPRETHTTCYSHYRRHLQSIAAAASLRAATSRTLLVSPFMWQWHAESQRDLRRLLGEQATWHWEVSVAGMPCINSSHIWNWPVHRVRHKFWKLSYEEYATGHETSPFMPLSQFWAVGDTTSGTRVYRTQVLATLMRSLAEREKEYPSMLPPQAEEEAPFRHASEVFVELDLLAKVNGIQSYTILQGTMFENSYRASAMLSPRLSRVFHIEAARFLPNSPQQQHCLFPSSSSASAFTSKHGVVVSWCTRNALRNMFRDVGGWWLALAPRGHIIVPVSASVLNIFRSGDTELFPWDADIDANFIADHEIVVGGFLEEHREELARLGYSFILRGDRAVIHNLADTARMDIWLSGPQEVSAFNIRARFCGIRINMFREQLDGTVWYYRPGEKIYGNTKGKLLHCTWLGHNACLPDCVRDGRGIGPDGCEFADRFVHLNT